MKAALYHIMKADHSPYKTEEDYIAEFNEGNEILYKSIHFQNLAPERKEMVESAWMKYLETKRNNLREIEALTRLQEREAAKPYPSINEVLERITATPELIPHFIGLLELDSTVLDYRDNIRKAVWYYKNNKK